MSNLTNAQIEKFVGDWYRALDVHDPMVNLLPMLADEGLRMVFPEAELKGKAAFESWYQGVIRIFFDEVHKVKSVGIENDGDNYNLKVVVEWQASVWKPPAAKSERIKLDAFQTWIVRSSESTGQPEILTYIVDRLEYHEGSAKL